MQHGMRMHAVLELLIMPYYAPVASHVLTSLIMSRMYLNNYCISAAVQAYSFDGVNAVNYSSPYARSTVTTAADVFALMIITALGLAAA